MVLNLRKWNDAMETYLGRENFSCYTTRPTDATILSRDCVKIDMVSIDPSTNSCILGWYALSKAFGFKPVAKTGLRSPGVVLMCTRDKDIAA